MQWRVDARVDLPVAERRQDWTEWMTRQIHDAGYVLVIASPEDKRRADGQAMPDQGRGVQWEARLIRDRFLRRPGSGPAVDRAGGAARQGPLPGRCCGC